LHAANHLKILPFFSALTSAAIAIKAIAVKDV
jgi:hypothetical protein